MSLIINKQTNPEVLIFHTQKKNKFLFVDQMYTNAVWF